MVVGLGLRDVKEADLFGELGDHLLALVLVDEAPGLVGVDLDALSHVVAVEAHAGDEHGVVLLPQLLVLLGDQVERPDCLGGSVADLGPVVGQALGDDGNEVAAELLEAPCVLLDLLVLLLGVLEDLGGGEEDGVNDEVGDLAHEAVDVVDALGDAVEDSLQLELVELHSDGLDDVLQDAHARLQGLPALRVVHSLARLVLVDLDPLARFQGLLGNLGVG
mmetsp:Transcript_11154/g.18726  ORF Transcript_11154/g.18726 Transcript_11154/m.18726 type:complete len:220 (-) Transcript_11154:551-1210(-)